MSKSDPGAEPTKPAIVLTDPPPLTASGRTTDCPQCGAPKAERTQARPFGPVSELICGRCAYSFGCERRHV